MKIDLNTILIIAGIAVFLLFGQSEPVKVNYTIKEIETRIQDSIIYVDRIKEVVRYEKQYLDTLYIERYKTTDTVRIIQIQDTIIYRQKEVIIKQDTIINTQGSIIQAKDSIITLERVKIKKKNKDIIKMTLIALGAGVVAILK